MDFIEEARKEKNIDIKFIEKLLVESKEQSEIVSMFLHFSEQKDFELSDETEKVKIINVKTFTDNPSVLDSFNFRSDLFPAFKALIQKYDNFKE